MNKFSSQATPAQANEVSPAVGYWLLGMGGLVAGMVTVGGVTRLTKSGLSMTDWKLQGSLPPMNDEEWQKEFDRYKQFPEWNQRKSMDIEEFKSIYFWEYGHRMFGRSLGLFFIGPMAYFSIRGMIPRSLYPRLFGLLGLGGAQGLIGWWMVKSGLEVDPEQKKEIRVSPYRLATHLGMAFTTYGLLLWTGLDILFPISKAKSVAEAIPADILKVAAKTRRFAVINAALVGITAMSGAFVAGNDAGRAYNTFPEMGDTYVPYEILDMEPLWRNFFENTATVQFDHRVLALSTYFAICTMYVRALGAREMWKAMPALARYAGHALAGMAGVQVGLGISTLLMYVPIPLAAAHQAGSLALLTCALGFVHSLRFSRFPSLVPAVVKKRSRRMPVASFASIRQNKNISS